MAMRLAVVILIVLGLLAAGAAAMLVQALKTDAPDDGVSDRVGVLVADVNLPARTRMTREHVRIEQAPAEGLPQGCLSDYAQGVGKVLKVAVIKGQPLTRAHFAAKDSIDDLLRPGMLAFPAPLPRRTTSTDLLYPGCVVDVFATFPLTNSSKGEAVVTPLLQNIQVLAVEDSTVIPPANEKEAEVAARRRTPSTSMNVLVTLEVTARQAAALQLALQKGTLGLAMRNPNDKSVNPLEAMVVKEGRLTTASEVLDPQTLALFSSLQEALGGMSLIKPNRPATDGVPAQTVPPLDGAALAPPEATRVVPPSRPAWRMTIIHGREVEEAEFELQQVQEKDPNGLAMAADGES
jgi:pilus assembly protein CpaB